MIRDPRYWRDKDPTLVQEVTRGFRRLYGPAHEVERAEAGRRANVTGATGSSHRSDTIIGHLSPGEIVVPKRAQTPEVVALPRRSLGDELAAHTVGSGMERRNPISGLPAFSDDRDTRSIWEALREGVLDLILESYGPPQPGGHPGEALVDPLAGLTSQFRFDLDRRQRQAVERALEGSPRGGGKWNPFDPSDEIFRQGRDAL